MPGSNTRTARAAYRERWAARQTRSRNQRTLKVARRALDARWVRLKRPGHPYDNLPPAGERVLLLGWVEIFDGWYPSGETPRYRTVLVMRVGQYWSSVESFTEIEGLPDHTMYIRAWQPLPPDWERWVAVTPVPEKGVLCNPEGS